MFARSWLRLVWPLMSLITHTIRWPLPSSFPTGASVASAQSLIDTARVVSECVLRVYARMGLQLNIGPSKTALVLDIRGRSS
eukprot:5350224-Alexandrium_andersonii.AAC.1